MSDGKVLTDFGLANDIATGIAVQADGKIVVGGYTIDQAGDFDFAFAGYQGSGRLDRNFGSQGLVTTDVGGDEVVNAIAFRTMDGSWLRETPARLRATTSTSP